MKMPPTHGRRGFTLIEVMLTLLIMAGIMITITQILTGTRRTRDSIHNIQERLLAGPAILDRLERDLRAIFIYNRDQRTYLRIDDRVLGGYDADSIDFVCSVDSLIPYREHDGEDFRRADYNEVGFHLRRNPGTDEFLELYRREDYGIDDEPFQGGSFSFLHDRVKAFDIRVYDEDGPEAEPLDGWGGNEEDEDTIGLPLRIEIELTIELKPRLTGEQIIHDRRTMTYKRIFRFPPSMLLAQDVQPIPVIPVINPPVPPSTAGGAGGEDPTTAVGGGGGMGGGGDGIDIIRGGGGGDGSGIFGGGDG